MTQAEILEQLKFDLELRGYSIHTHAEYLTKVKIFQNYFGKPASELGEPKIREFLHYLATEKKLGSGSINTYNSALRFLYGVALNISLNYWQIPRRKQNRKIPDILTMEEVKSLFDACDNLRDKCLLMTIYGAGLRVSEAANLKVADIDSQKMSILIRNGKGGKDRYALLSHKNLDILREYWRAYRPRDYLFKSRNTKSPHLTPRGIQNAFYKYVEKAGITKKVSIHTLRHCFATHLLEAGTNIFLIKQLLGHSNIKSTCFYLHLLKISSLDVTSPLDLLEEMEKNNG
jgi:integrase/recombinase XerD